MQIKGAEELSVNDFRYELQNGGRIVVYQYCISVLVMTFKRGSKIFLIKNGESAIKNGLIYTLISLILGWWGIPWGPIYTIGALITNFRGGKDVTNEILASLNAQN